MAGVLRLVTLDITNTILRVVRSPGYQYMTVAEVYGIKTSEDEMNVVFKEKYKQYCKKYPNFGETVNMSSYKWWTDLVKECFQSLGLISQEDTLNQVANHLYLHYSTAKPWEKLPYTNQVLQKLKNSGVKVGIISNFDERLNVILEHVALRHFFDFVLPSYVVGFEKPGVQIFQKALKIADVDCTEAVHIGDSYDKDFLGAKSAGFQAYLLDMEGKSNKLIDKQFIVKDLNGLYEKIKTKLPNYNK